MSNAFEEKRLLPMWVVQIVLPIGISVAIGLVGAGAARTLANSERQNAQSTTIEVVRNELSHLKEDQISLRSQADRIERKVDQLLLARTK